MVQLLVFHLYIMTDVQTDSSCFATQNYTLPGVKEVYSLNKHDNIYK